MTSNRDQFGYGVELPAAAREAYNKGDYAAVHQILRPLADEGDAGVQFVFGLLFFYGLGVPQDDMQAVAWYRAAADKGQPNAQHSLGFMYSVGRGVPQDFNEAVRCYRMAAEQGNPWGQFNLAITYADGRGVEQDFVQAHRWYNLAASQGHEDAAKVRDELAELMTPEQIADAQRLAREWRPKTP